MAYATGTVNSPTQLKSVITSFCTTNGWSLSGNVLYKGTSFNILTDISSEVFSIKGTRNSAGTLDTCEYARYIYIVSTSWPVTYYIQTNVNPDLVVVVLQYDTNKFQQIIFGNISKIHASAFPGGNWFWASKFANPALGAIEPTLTINPGLYLFDNNSLEIYANNPQIGTNIPFSRAYTGESNITDGNGPKMVNGLYLGIDGLSWDSGLNPNPRTAVHFSHITSTLLAKSPNTWNGQTHLVPMHIMYNTNGGQMYLGHIEHIRYIRMDNYNPGDIITLGTDKWKAFPWSYKDTVNRNGSPTIPNCLGTLGFCFRYDGA